jgi:phage I-like protein
VTDPAVYFRSQPLVRAVDAPDAPLPSEFLLFPAGASSDVNGTTVVFDARSAELILAHAALHGADFMIDLEHQSIFGFSENSRDARGWFRVAERDGALWAVDVTWTPDGESRLRERRQRYTSPAFLCDERDDAGVPRVTSLLNAAICSMPASYGNTALVASAGPRLDSLRPSAYARDTMAATPEVKPADPTTAEPAKAPVEAKTDDVLVEPAKAEAAPADSALNAAERAELEKLRAEQNARETAERRSLVTELISLGAETPATAWSNNAPTARLAAEPLPELRSRVAALRSVPRPTSAGHTAPPAGSGAPQGEEALEDYERADAAKIKDPEARARFVAKRLARKQKAQ